MRVKQYQNPMWEWTILYEYLKNDVPNPLLPLGLNYTDMQTLVGFFLARGGQFDDFLFTDISDINGFVNGNLKAPLICYVGPALLSARWTALTKVEVGYSVFDDSNHWQQVTAVGVDGGVTGTYDPHWNDSGSFTADGVGSTTVTWQDRGLMPGSGYPNELAELQVVTDGTNWYSPVQRSWGGLFYEDVTDLNGAINVYANGALQSGGGGSYTLGGPGLAISGYSFNGLYLQWVHGEPTDACDSAIQFLLSRRIQYGQDRDRAVHAVLVDYRRQ